VYFTCFKGKMDFKENGDLKENEFENDDFANDFVKV
jgi:hypothetical protein